MLINQINISLSKAYELALNGDKDSALDLIRKLLKYLQYLDPISELDILLKIIMFISEFEELEFYDKFIANEISNLEKSIEHNNDEAIRFLARIKAEIARLYAKHGVYPDKILNEALALYDELSGKSEYVIDLLSFLTVVYADINKQFKFYDKAREVLEKYLHKTGIDAIENIDDHLAPYASEFFIAIAELESLMGDYNKAINYLTRALDIYLSINQFLDAINIAVVISDIIAKASSKEKAIEFLHKIKKRIPNKDIIGFIDAKIRELRD